MVRSTQLPNYASIFRAELCATTLAIDFVCHIAETPTCHFLYLMSSLEAMSGFKLELDLVQKIIKYLPTMGKHSSFVGFQVM